MSEKPKPRYIAIKDGLTTSSYVVCDRWDYFKVVVTTKMTEKRAWKIAKLLDKWEAQR
ncbi:MAG: hypothetical protein M0Z92_09360 [Actinomycetota bacterium]|nr:hypothetical protein [Actinomycetota bacterium]